MSGWTEDKTPVLNPELASEIDDNLTDRPHMIQNIVYRSPDIAIRDSENHMQTWTLKIQVYDSYPLAQLSESYRKIGRDSALAGTALEGLDCNDTSHSSRLSPS